MSAPLESFVEVHCRPGGSKRFVGRRNTGTAIVIDANPEVAAWKETVRLDCHCAGLAIS